VRGFVLGLIFVPLLLVSLLSLRPGGLRHQLKNVFRRLRLVLVLGGIVVFGSAVIRIVFGAEAVTDYLIGGLWVVVAIAFIVLGQDRPLES
jgi:hypothetical protein